MSKPHGQLPELAQRSPIVVIKLVFHFHLSTASSGDFMVWQYCEHDPWEHTTPLVKLRTALGQA